MSTLYDLSRTMPEAAAIRGQLLHIADLVTVDAPLGAVIVELEALVAQLSAADAAMKAAIELHDPLPQDAPLDR